jgi:hypothetical protein
MITFESTGDFKKTQDFLNKMAQAEFTAMLSHYGQVGVDALASATPTDSGLTASSWTYTIEKVRGKYSLIWHNTNVVDGVPVAILIQYGHGTGTGGWVEGRDYINPSIRPIFDMITEEVWRQVTQ